MVKHTCYIKNYCCLMALAVFLLLGYSSVQAAEKSNTSPHIIVMDVGLLEILAAMDLDNNIVLMPEDPAFTEQYPEVPRYNKSINGEYLMLLQPDIILYGNLLRDSGMIAQAKMMGIETQYINRALPVEKKVTRMAEIFQLPAKKDKVLQGIALSFSKARTIAQHNTDQPRVIHVSATGAGGQVAMAGRETPAYELIKSAGGKSLDTISLFSGYKPVTSEGLIQIAPEVILVSDLEIDALGGTKGIWKNIPGLSATPAGINHQLIIVSHKGLKNGSIETARIVDELAETLSQISQKSS